MPDHRTRNRSGARNNKELTDIDERSEASRHKDHRPSVGRHGRDIGDVVDEGNGEEEHDGGDGRLVEKQLGGVHLQLFVVGADENCVECGSTDACEGEDDSDDGGLFLSAIRARFGVIADIVSGLSWV